MMLPNKQSYNKNWTDQENADLAKIVVELVNSGLKFKDAYKVAATTLGRTEYSVQKQWCRNLREEHSSKITKKSNNAAENIPKKENIVNINHSGIESGSLEEAEQIAKAHTPVDTKVDDAPTLTDAMSFLQNQLVNSGLVKKSTNTSNDIANATNIANKAYDGRAKATPKKGTTQLAALRKSIETFESEQFRVLNSGKEGLEYIVINNEEDKGYLVKVDGEKVVSCNCPHYVYRNVTCKHILKIAFDKNLEVY